MDTGLLILGILILLSSLLVGVVILFVCYRVLIGLTRKKFNIEKGNAAYGIFVASILLSCGLVVESSLNPLTNLYRILSKTSESSGELFLNFSLYSTGFIALALFVAFVVIVTGVYLFTVMTRKLKEFEEISNNNISVGLMVAAIVIVLALFTRDAVQIILDSLIPYPPRVINGLGYSITSLPLVV